MDTADSISAGQLRTKCALGCPIPWLRALCESKGREAAHHTQSRLALLNPKHVGFATYFLSESSTASACATRPADMLLITSFVKKNFPSAGTIMICNLSESLSAIILLI